MDTLANVLNDHPEVEASRIPRSKLDGPIVWTRDSLSPTDGIVALDPDAAAELDAMIALLRDNPLPVEFLEPSMFKLAACTQLMERCRQILEEGVGFVIIDRLPMERYSRAEAKAAYWVLAQLLSRPVAQSWDGKVIYDVRDTGKRPGNGVRPDITNAEQNFHTDNSYNLCPPDYVALLCLQTAKAGGVSSIVSFYTVLNEMLARRPDLVDRLFMPYLFDRQKEHAPDSPPVISHPLMQMDGDSVLCRLSHRHVVNGYKMAGMELDPVSEEALETLESIMRQPEFIREFYFEPGQIQIVDNRRLGHRRSGFTDYEEEDRKRHLIRLWLRREGRRFYNG